MSDLLVSSTEEKEILCSLGGFFYIGHLIQLAGYDGYIFVLIIVTVVNELSINHSIWVKNMWPGCNLLSAVIIHDSCCKQYHISLLAELELLST